MPCHLIEQHIAVHAVRRIEQDEYLRLVIVLGKGCERAFQRLGRGVIAQSCGPQHTACIAAATLESSSLVELLDNLGCHGRDIGLRVSLQHVLERLLELIVVLLGQVAQCVNEHELGHNLGERVLAHHFGVCLVYRAVVVREVVGVCALVHVLLVAGHVLEVLQIIGILHRHAVFRFREQGKDAVAIGLGIAHLSVAHKHHVHIIEHVQAIGVIGIAFQQLVELVGGCTIVFHLVLEDDAHVVQSFLDNVVGRLDFLFGFGNLLEVVFLIVRVFGTFHCLQIHLDGVTGNRIDEHAVFECHQCAVVLLVFKRESRLVASAPVVLKLAVSPQFLELGLTGILEGGVIKVP